MPLPSTRLGIIIFQACGRVAALQSFTRIAASRSLSESASGDDLRSLGSKAQQPSQQKKQPSAPLPADAQSARRQSGYEASTSSSDAGKREKETQESRKGNRREEQRVRSIAELRPAAAKILGMGKESAQKQEKGKNSDEEQKGPQKTLEAKRAYRRELAERAKKIQDSMAAQKRDNKRDPTTIPPAIEGLAPPEPNLGEVLLAGKTLRDQLTHQDCTKYVEIDKSLLPEVFADNKPQRELMHPKGGCPGLSAEMTATHSDLIMHRECTQQLLDIVEGKSRRHLYLTGPPSSGRSIALATIVSVMRAKGWLVMYIPQAKQLTHGGFFYPNDKGGWDTPESAKLVMEYLMRGNPDRVKTEPSAKNGQSLQSLIEAALENSEASEVVGAFLEVKETVLAASNAMIVIDGYQALYHPSEYGEWLSNFNRRVIQPEELRVAAALRVLEQPPLQDGIVLCAAEKSGALPPQLRMPMPKDAMFVIPRMNREEWVTMATHYDIKAITDNLSPLQVQKAFFCLNGNAKEYRRMADIFSLHGAGTPVAARI